jgi:hypothetical protein
MKQVIIIGGGIAGLVASHELIEQNYTVLLIERNDIVGGLARTYQNEEKKICPYEYSWRAYGKWYQNVYDIMKRIQFDSTHTVYDKLVILQGGEKTCSKKIPSYEKTFKNIPLYDYLKIIIIIIKYILSCDQRNINNFSKIGIRQHIKTNNISIQTENVVGKIVGPYLGFDYHNASMYDILYNYEMMAYNSSPKNNFNISLLPTNFVWFEPWIKLLKSKGLVIKLNTEVQHINIHNKNIKNINIYDKSLNTKYILTADYYINCTGPEQLEKLLYPYKNINYLQSFYNSIDKVASNGRQIQLSIYYYLDRKIFLDNKNTLAYLPNTPWLLMVLPTGHIWGDKYLNKYCNKNIKEIISVGICEPYVNGLLIKKPWAKCTPKEIEIEAWYQLINDKDFINNICIEKNSSIKDINILHFTMWDSYIYKDGNIDTFEPKWANNINTIQYRPNSTTPIENLFLGGAYTNTTTGTYSMESAAESGKIVAKSICIADNHKDNIYLHIKSKNTITSFIRLFDSYLYKLNLNIMIFIILIIIIFRSKK